MTNEQIIEEAVQHLATHNRVGEEIIRSLIVQGAKAVYVKIRPDAYGMMIFGLVSKNYG